MKYSKVITILISIIFMIALFSCEQKISSKGLEVIDNTFKSNLDIYTSTIQSKIQDSENNIINKINNDKIELKDSIDNRNIINIPKNLPLKMKKNKDIKKIKSNNKIKVNKKLMLVDKKQIDEINYFDNADSTKLLEDNPNDLINPLTPEKAIKNGKDLIEKTNNEIDLTNVSASYLNIKQPNNIEDVNNTDNTLKIKDVELIFDKVPGSSEPIKKESNYIIKIEPNTLDHVILILKKDLENNFEDIKKELNNKRVELQKSYDDLKLQNDVIEKQLIELKEKNKINKENLEIEKKIVTENEILELKKENSTLKQQIEDLKETINNEDEKESD